MKDYKRGEIYYANLGDLKFGSEQSGTRPVLIVQNNIGNKYSPTLIVACMTGRIYKNEIPTHVFLSSKLYNLPSDSLILCEQIKTIDKTRMLNYVDALNKDDEIRLNTALRISINL